MSGGWEVCGANTTTPEGTHFCDLAPGHDGFHESQEGWTNFRWSATDTPEDGAVP